jgi:co-chaperonin GroES (HSP10)
MRVRLLRGQVVIRENLRGAADHLKHIIVPDVFTTHNPDAVQEARTWHRGRVLAMGAPMLTPTGAEVPHGFEVGDEVIFHWAHHEKSWTREWVDGEPAAWVPQWAVDAVVEP